MCESPAHASVSALVTHGGRGVSAFGVLLGGPRVELEADDGTRRKAQKFGARGTTLKAYKPQE